MASLSAGDPHMKQELVQAQVRDNRSTNSEKLKFTVCPFSLCNKIEYRRLRRTAHPNLLQSMTTDCTKLYFPDKPRINMSSGNSGTFS
eukprot:9278574-Alexandrium_andersonii.AAC.1